MMPKQHHVHGHATVRVKIAVDAENLAGAMPLSRTAWAIECDPLRPAKAV